uniref:Uncharacterized protein n=1 Tax=Heliothis virescens TaxID=7102 RepID=A0A2A4IYG9_HELVI
MAMYIGFIVALVLAALVIIWIAYCMFVRERHKSERFHHNIADIQHKNYVLSQMEDEVPVKKDLGVGVFVLPSRHKQKTEDYDKRPDYPESPVHVTHQSTDKLIHILNESADDLHYKDGIYEVDSHQPCHSEV